MTFHCRYETYELSKTQSVRLDLPRHRCSAVPQESNDLLACMQNYYESKVRKQHPISH